mmetsp:Transcript_23565/g.35285  ORF Transcript_23565/g.35285 Transcript_23565/m.35285 type:complete len:415 (+) Transcript_23565:70-1314(+)
MEKAKVSGEGNEWHSEKEMECVAQMSRDDSRPRWIPAMDQLNRKRQRKEEERRKKQDEDVTKLVLEMPTLCGDKIPNSSIKMEQLEKKKWIKLRWDAAKTQGRFKRMTLQISSMLRPTACIILIVGLYVAMIGKREDQEDKILYRTILHYQENPSDSLAQKMRGSLINASLVVAGIFGITIIFVVGFAFKLRKAVYWFLIIILGGLLCGPWGYITAQFFIHYHPFPLDAISYAFFLYNFTLCGLFCLSLPPFRKSILNKAFLVLLSASLTWPFTEFPELTVWWTLALLTIYDLLAVLAPCGPLRFIMEKEVSSIAEFPGLMYTGQYFRLGLGDFVFYGVLIGRSMFLDPNTTISCCMAVSMGLVATIIITCSAKSYRAIPALPVSVVLGFLFYVTTPLVVNKYLDALARPFFTD